MKTHESRTLLTSFLGIALAAAFSGAAFALDPNEEQLVRHGWNPYIETAPNEDGELGFSDPRAGDSSYATAAYQDTSMRANAKKEGGPRFAEPRPGAGGQ